MLYKWVLCEQISSNVNVLSQQRLFTVEIIAVVVFAFRFSFLLHDALHASASVCPPRVAVITAISQLRTAKLQCFPDKRCRQV